MTRSTLPRLALSRRSFLGLAAAASAVAALPREATASPSGEVQGSPRPALSGGAGCLPEAPWTAHDVQPLVRPI